MCHVAFTFLYICVVQFQVKCCNPQNCETGEKCKVLVNKYVAFIVIILLCFSLVLFHVKCCNPKKCETGKKCWRERVKLPSLNVITDRNFMCIKFVSVTLTYVLCILSLYY